jgi:hypothetical protein
MPESEPKPKPLEPVTPGSGRAWKAVLKNGQAVVVHEIAVPPAEVAASAPRLQRLFERRHPALSPIWAWGTEAAGVWVAVDPNEGVPLSTILAKGRLRPPAAAALGASLLSGIGALHESGIAMGGFDATAVRVTGNGEVRIAGHPAAAVRGAPSQSDLRADVRSCGMAICAAFGVDPAGAPAPPEIPPGLVVTMRSMASGAMGPAADRAQGALREMASALLAPDRAMASQSELALRAGGREMPNIAPFLPAAEPEEPEPVAEDAPRPTGASYDAPPRAPEIYKPPTPPAPAPPPIPPIPPAPAYQPPAPPAPASQPPAPPAPAYLPPIAPPPPAAAYQPPVAPTPAHQAPVQPPAAPQPQPPTPPAQEPAYRPPVPPAPAYQPPNPAAAQPPSVPPPAPPAPAAPPEPFKPKRPPETAWTPIRSEPELPVIPAAAATSAVPRPSSSTRPPISPTPAPAARRTAAPRPAIAESPTGRPPWLVPAAIAAVVVILLGAVGIYVATHTSSTTTGPTATASPGGHTPKPSTKPASPTPSGVIQAVPTYGPASAAPVTSVQICTTANPCALAGLAPDTDTSCQLTGQCNVDVAIYYSDSEAQVTDLLKFFDRCTGVETDLTTGRDPTQPAWRSGVITHLNVRLPVGVKAGAIVALSQAPAVAASTPLLLGASSC